MPMSALNDAWPPLSLVSVTRAGTTATPNRWRCTPCLYQLATTCPFHERVRAPKTRCTFRLHLTWQHPNLLYPLVFIIPLVSHFAVVHPPCLTLPSCVSFVCISRLPLFVCLHILAFPLLFFAHLRVSVPHFHIFAETLALQTLSVSIFLEGEVVSLFLELKWCKFSTKIERVASGTLLETHTCP
jgi:hypothetical protein